MDQWVRLDLIDKSNSKSALNPNLLVKLELSARAQHAIKKDSNKNKNYGEPCIGGPDYLLSLIFVRP